MKLTWYPLAPADARNLLSGVLSTYCYKECSVVRDAYRLYNVLRVDFDTPDELGASERRRFMQTLLLAAEIKVHEWKDPCHNPSNES